MAIRIVKTSSRKDIETILINKNRRFIRGNFNIFKIKDGDYSVIVIPAFNITSYGKTHKEAFDMLDEIVNDYFSSLIRLDKEKISKELFKYGWEPGIFSKRYHNKSYVDEKGVLKNLDLPEDTNIEKSKVEFA